MTRSGSPCVKDDGATDGLASAISIEAVLTATPEQRHSWFAGRVVLVGPALPGEDEYALADGRKIFGCQIQRLAFDSFLAQTQVVQISFVSLLLRTSLWCLVALAIVPLMPIRAARPLGGLVAVCLPIAVVSPVFGVIGLLLTQSPWTVELVLGACTLLTAGGVAYLVRAMRERQQLLVSGVLWTSSGAADSASAAVTARDALHFPAQNDDFDESEQRPH